MGENNIPDVRISIDNRHNAGYGVMFRLDEDRHEALVMHQTWHLGYVMNRYLAVSNVVQQL